MVMNFKIWSIFSTILYFAAAILFIVFAAGGQDWALYTAVGCMAVALITGAPLRKKLREQSRQTDESGNEKK